jgi:hypothetical protein
VTLGRGRADTGDVSTGTRLGIDKAIGAPISPEFQTLKLRLTEPSGNVHVHKTEQRVWTHLFDLQIWVLFLLLNQEVVSHKIMASSSFCFISWSPWPCKPNEALGFLWVGHITFQVGFDPKSWQSSKGEAQKSIKSLWKFHPSLGRQLWINSERCTRPGSGRSACSRVLSTLSKLTHLDP